MPYLNLEYLIVIFYSVVDKHVPPTFLYELSVLPFVPHIDMVNTTYYSSCSSALNWYLSENIDDDEDDDDGDDNGGKDDGDNDDYYDDDDNDGDFKSRINIAISCGTIVPLAIDRANLMRPAVDSHIIRLHSKDREINSGHHASTMWP